MPKFTKAERQYIKGIVHNYTLQRWSDQDIVDYLHNEKKIDLTRSMISKIRNQAEQDAQGWYSELTQSSFKSIAFYKERLDSLLSYQKKLNEIMSNCAAPEIGIRAIAELHRIEMSLHNLLKEVPEFQIVPENQRGPRNCNCIPTGTITHSQCRYCNQVWCPTTLNQDWCPNPECSHGIKGNEFKPYDEHFEWVQCSTCKMWFKTPDILAVHHCYIQANPEPVIESPEWVDSKPVSTPKEQPVIEVTAEESNTEPEPEEILSEADLYWQTHPRMKPRN